MAQGAVLVWGDLYYERRVVDAMIEPYYQEQGITIYHGNCIEILPHLKHVDLILTDPPYGINLKSSWNGKYGICHIAGDDSYELRDMMLQQIKFSRALIFGSWKVPRPLNTKCILIWEKGGHTGMGDLSIPWKPNYEEIYVLGTGYIGKRDSSILHYIADRECNGPVRERYHPTEKPIQLIKALLKKSPGNVLDPFMGSGTTLRAAKDLGRQAIGIEIEEKYCEIAVRRLGQEVLKFDPGFLG